MKNKILEVIHNSKRPISKQKILNLLKIDEINQQNEILIILNELKSLKIIFTNFDNKFYSKFKNDFIGHISLNKRGFGFVKYNEDKKYYVHNKYINGAFDNDEVLFTIKKFITKSKEILYEGKVIRVLKRNNKNIIGVVVKEEKTNRKVLKILNSNSTNKIAYIFNESYVVVGNIVSGKIMDYKNNYINNTINYVKVMEILGNINEPGIDILAIVKEHNLKNKFDIETLKEAQKIPLSLSKEMIQKSLINDKRVDLTTNLLVTIDGEDAKDLDDAICVTKLENGNYNLIVAIADVSNYVIDNSFLDKEALKRGASAYLVDRVIPMLPERLSNGICSLNPNEYRYCMVADMEINEKGETIKTKIYQGVMKSYARLTYTNVNKLFNGQNINIDDKLKKMLLESKELYKILSDYKNTSGIINLDLKEPKFYFNDDGKIIDIKIKERFDAEKLIESFMIRANEEVAFKINKMNLPFIYRIHPKPKNEKIQALFNYLTLFGIDMRNFKNDNSPKSFQQIIYKLKSYDNNQLTLTLFLRSMEKAIYSEKNDGHFGLASKYYTHFTSPIRRYPDLLVHRLLKEYLINKNYSKKNIEYFKNIIKSAADLSTTNEIKIVDCEREVEKMKKSEYMEQFIDKEFDGIISSVVGFGFFVVLDNTIEGLVHISDLEDDHYIFHENSLKLIGERTKKTFSIGDKIKIKVKNASKINKTIDFIISENN